MLRFENLVLFSCVAIFFMYLYDSNVKQIDSNKSKKLLSLVNKYNDNVKFKMLYNECIADKKITSVEFAYLNNMAREIDNEKEINHLISIPKLIEGSVNE